MGNIKSSSFTEGSVSQEDFANAIAEFTHNKEQSKFAAETIFSPKSSSSKRCTGILSDDENGNPFGSPRYTSPADSSFVLSLSPRSEGDFDFSSYFPPTPTSPPANNSPFDFSVQKDVVITPKLTQSAASFTTPQLESLHVSPKGSRRSRRGGLCAFNFSQVPASIRSLRSETESREIGGGAFEDLPHSEALLRRQRRHNSSRRAGSMVAAQGSEYNNVLYSYGSVRTTGTSSSYFESISSEAFSPRPRHERKNPRRVHGRIRGESPVVRRRLPEYGGCNLPVE